MPPVMSEAFTLLTEPPRLPLVLPSILAADFAALGDDVADVLNQGADGVHVDIMDGHFVPNVTMGPATVKALRRRFADLYLDVHLMMTNPELYAEPFAEAGANCITFHIEPTAGRAENDEMGLIRLIRDCGCDVGVSLNPGTEPEAIEHVLDEVELVLVMSVNPGFGGQSFMPEVLEKTRWIAERIPQGVRLEMDGGLDPTTVGAAREAGVDTIVAGSAVFGVEDRAAAIRQLRGEV